MIGIFLLLTLCLSGGYLLTGVLALMVAVDVLLKALYPSHSNLSYLMLLLVVSIPPATGYLSGVFFDHFALVQNKTRVFAPLGVIAGFCWVLGSDDFVGFIEQAIRYSQSSDPVAIVRLCLHCFSVILFCASAIALSLIVASLFFELPLQWMAAGSSFQAAIPYAALRPLLLILGMSLSANLILGLCQEEFSLNRVFQLSSASKSIHSTP